MALAAVAPEEECLIPTLSPLGCPRLDQFLRVAIALRVFGRELIIRLPPLMLLYLVHIIWLVYYTATNAVGD